MSIIIMGVIFYFSSRNGEASTNDSHTTYNGIVYFCKPILSSSMVNFLYAHLRKMAHLFLFCVLGIFYSLSIKEYLKTYKPKLYRSGLVYISVIFGFIYGCTDELHQYLIPGRDGKFSDVLIDTLGSLIGTSIVFIILFFTKHKELSDIQNS